MQVLERKSEFTECGKPMPNKTNAICVQQAGSKRNHYDYTEDRSILAEFI